MIKPLGKTLIIDTKDTHINEENVFAIPPQKLSWLSYFQKESFDNALIKNTPVSFLKSMGLFYLAQSVKRNGFVEIIVDQPISVMQSLDASEIEANAKLAGFVDVQETSYETWIQEGGKDVKYATIKISMVRPEKIVSSEGKK